MASYWGHFLFFQQIATVKTETRGMLIGFIGIFIFSLTLPVTKIAVQTFNPYFIAFARAVLAGVLAAIYLFSIKAKLPGLSELRQFVIVAIGVVFIQSPFLSLYNHFSLNSSGVWLKWAAMRSVSFFVNVGVIDLQQFEQLRQSTSCHISLSTSAAIESNLLGTFFSSLERKSFILRLFLLTLTLKERRLMGSMVCGGCLNNW